jgi:hypothetical protein
MLTSAGALPQTSFDAHAQRLEAIAEEVRLLASSPAGTDLRSADDDEGWYQCYSLADLHIHFSLPPTFGRIVHAGSLPGAWLSDADRTLLLDPEAFVALPASATPRPGTHTRASAPTTTTTTTTDLGTGEGTEEVLPSDVGWARIEAAYLSSASRAEVSGGAQAPGGGHVVVDSALRPAAAQALHRWLLETTHWHDPRHGYLGTYLDQ